MVLFRETLVFLHGAVCERKQDPGQRLVERHDAEPYPRIPQHVVFAPDLPPPSPDEVVEILPNEAHVTFTVKWELEGTQGILPAATIRAIPRSVPPRRGNLGTAHPRRWRPR